LTCGVGSVIDFLMTLIPTKRIHEEEISVPQMRGCPQLVRTGRRGPDSTMPVRAYALSLQGARGRYYRDALRSACARCIPARRGHQDSKMPDGSSQSPPPAHTHRRDRGENWIKGKGNGIARCDIDGQRIARTGRGEKRIVRGVDLEAYLNSTNTIESRRQRSR
jgi:hypothetical protein